MKTQVKIKTKLFYFIKYYKTFLFSELPAGLKNWNVDQEKQEKDKDTVKFSKCQPSNLLVQTYRLTPSVTWTLIRFSKK